MASPRSHNDHKTEVNLNATMTVEEFLECKSAKEAATMAWMRYTVKTTGFDLAKYEQLPRFAAEELEMGPELGKGTFSNVFEIKDIQVADREPTRRNGRKESEDDNFQSKLFIAQHCRRDDHGGDARYAIKYLRREATQNYLAWKQGAVDLATEAAILSTIAHPNIVKLRGLNEGDFNAIPIEPGFFLVLDRLYDTLQVRIEKWSKQKVPLAKSVFNPSYATRKKKKRLGIRLKVAFDLLQALGYLHKRRILYRDLKPENVGFDVRGDVKLFDFGLAMELPPSSRSSSRRLGKHDELFPLVGCVGTPRYMAPEVALKKPYGLSADVYSFTMLLYEITSLKEAFKHLTDYKLFFEHVVTQNQRPEIPSFFSPHLSDLITDGWSSDIQRRPNITQLVNVLRMEITELRDGDDTGLDAEYFRRESSTRMKMFRSMFNLIKHHDIDDDEPVNFYNSR